MLTKAMTIHELLTKNLFEINLKRNNNVTFWDIFNLKLKCDKWFKDQMLCTVQLNAKQFNKRIIKTMSKEGVAYKAPNNGFLKWKIHEKNWRLREPKVC
jgi:hypothetical protein